MAADASARLSSSMAVAAVEDASLTSRTSQARDTVASVDVGGWAGGQVDGWAEAGGDGVVMTAFRLCVRA